jgi:hypothetical protein
LSFSRSYYQLIPSHFNMVAQEEEQYHPKDALGSAIKATAITTGAGLFVSTIQNTLTKQNHGAMGAFTKFGGTTAVYGTRQSRSD